MAQRYNFIFEALVKSDNDLVGMVAYTLYKRQKIEWIEKFRAEHANVDPTEEELEAGFSKFTNMASQHHVYREQAVQMLDRFLDQALYHKVGEYQRQLRDDAIVNAVNKPFSKSVFENLVAGLVASLVTLGAAGLVWVASKGPENLMREAIERFLGAK